MKVKPYKLDKCQELYEHALEQSRGRHQMWSDMEYAVRHGELPGRTDVDESELDASVQNVLLPHLDIMVASSISHDPKLLVETNTPGPDSDTWERLTAAVLSHLWDQSEATAANKRAARDMFILGAGLTKTTWYSAVIEQELDPEEIAQAREEALAEEQALALAEGREPRERDEVLAEVAETEEVSVQSPVVAHISPYDIFVNEDATGLHDVRWLAHRVIRPLDELREKFPRRDIRPTSVSREAWAQGRRDPSQEKGPEEMAEIIEFYDHRSRTLTIFQVGAERPLSRQPYPWSHSDLPFTMLRCQEDSTEFWPYGVIEGAVNIQLALNDVHAARIENLTKAGERFLARAEHLVAGFEDALLDMSPGGVYEIDGLPDGVALADVIHQLRIDDRSPELWDTAEYALREALRLTMGVNEYQAGGVGPDRAAATTTATIDAMANLRAMQRTAQVEKSIAQCGTILLMLAMDNLEAGDVVKIAGPQGSTWAPLPEEARLQSYGVKVEGGSTSMTNPQVLQARAMQMFSTVIPALMQLGMDPTNAVRQAVSDLGMDPDYLIQKVQPAPAPAGQPPAAGGAPAAGDQADGGLADVLSALQAAGAGGEDPQLQAGGVAAAAEQNSGLTLGPVG